MTQRVYRSAQGKNVDIGALQLQNETVRAVGNMGVNARGDKINPNNRTIDSKNNRAAGQYRKQTANVVDSEVVSAKPAKAAKATNTQKPAAKSTAPKKQKPAPTKVEKQPVETAVEDKPLEDPVIQKGAEKEVAPDTVAEIEAKTEAKPKPVGGLADAIAKAKTVKQEPLKTPRQQAQERQGVKRI